MNHKRQDFLIRVLPFALLTPISHKTDWRLLILGAQSSLPRSIFIICAAENATGVPGP